MNQKTAQSLEASLIELQDHLRDELIPFWLDRALDEKFGGYLAYFDRDGAPTGETVKTLVCQTRLIYTFSALARAGFAEDRARDLAGRGVDFLLDRFWDDAYTGWYWTTERDGTPVNTSKIVYGHSFAMYALSEYAMATGDLRGMEWASRTYETVQCLAADNFHGGYYEFFDREWNPKPAGKSGGDRKSFDVHMHLMEACTNMFEASGAEIYRRRTEELIELLFGRMLHPDHGTAYAQFSPSWTPIRATLFEDVWGADREVDDPEGRPFDNTSYGHNVEFAWLYNHARHLLGHDNGDRRETLRKSFDHAKRYGIDTERGGIFCEGPHDAPARERNKEFWQQAEAMIGFLDAYLLFKDEGYLDAYQHVHRFVFDHMINHEVGEWFALFDKDNKLVRDHLGSAWKIGYHTVRSMLQTEARLIRILV